MMDPREEFDRRLDTYTTLFQVGIFDSHNELDVLTARVRLGVASFKERLRYYWLRWKEVKS